jgi:SAM-dependent methyltransferase
VPVTCCRHCCGLEREFDAATAAADLERYRKRGPLPTTRILLRELTRRGIGGSTLLDIGGGIGAIYHELLPQGLAEAVHVDASSAYLAAAAEEARRREHAGRVRFMHGDCTELAPEIPAADIVTLDRVICCYPDLRSLVSVSAARARRLYGLVYPRENWWMRPFFPLANSYFWIRRCPFRVFLHRTRDVEAVLLEQGLQPLFRASTILWQVALYGR